MIRKLFILSSMFFCALIVQSCKLPDEDIVFKQIQNIQVKKIDGSEAYVTAEAIFHNPNDMSMKLRSVDVDLEIEGKKVATVNQEKNVKIGANTDFVVPIDVKFDLKESGLLGNIFSILGGKKLKARYKGHIKASLHGVPFKVPVDHEDEIKLR